MSLKPLNRQEEYIPSTEMDFNEGIGDSHNLNIGPKESLPLKPVNKGGERVMSSKNGHVSGTRNKVWNIDDDRTGGYNIDEDRPDCSNIDEERPNGSNKVQGEKVVKIIDPKPELTTSSFKYKVSPSDTISESNVSLHAMEKFYGSNVDRGWAFVVLISVFIIFFIRSGMLSTSGLYYVVMLEEYGHSRSYTAWLGALYNSVYYLMGPISAMFIRCFGSRPSIILGSLLMTFGYLASAFTTSLELLFFTYGVVAATGMNFCYSGQIIALAQYFDKWHSLATSIAMTGTGFGMFALSQLIEYCIQNYGWRGSFIINAGMCIHVVICGQLIFPLPESPTYVVVGEDPEMEKKLSEASLHSEHTVANIQNTQHYFYEKHIGERTFSSLRMSLEASYLSSSILSINLMQQPPNNSVNNSYTVNRNETMQEMEMRGLRSRQGSIISRGSYIALGGIRNNPHSFHVSSRSAWGQPSKSFSRKDSTSTFIDMSPRFLRGNSQSIIRNNSKSFIREKPNGTIQRNPLSFVRHNSTVENEAFQVDDQGKERFIIGDEFIYEEEEEDISESQDADAIPISLTYDSESTSISLCSTLKLKMKHFCITIFKSLSGDKEGNPLLDPRFWLMDFAVFFGTIGASTHFVIYKDLADFLGVIDHYSTGLSAMGIGDMVGRIAGGVLTSTTWADPLLCYSVSIASTGSILGAHLLVNNSITFLFLAIGFGFFYGIMNILLAVAPSKVFGRDKLVTVFGNILFLSGIGAFIGPPITGTIADKTGSYVGVVFFSMTCLITGGMLMFLAYALNKIKQTDKQGVIK